MGGFAKMMLMMTMALMLVLLWGAISSNRSQEDHIRTIEKEKEQETVVFGDHLRNLEKRIEILDKEVLKERRLAEAHQQVIRELQDENKHRPPPPLPPPPPPPPVDPVNKVPVPTVLTPEGYSLYVPPPEWGGVRALKREAAKKEALITKQVAEASEKRLAMQPQTPWTPLGSIGVILNAYGDEKYVKDALAVARNLQAVMPMIKSITIWAHSANKPFLDEIAQEKPYIKPRYYEDVSIPYVVPKCPKFQAPPPMFLAKIVALTHSPYDTTIVMDNDINICNDFQHLYPTPQRNYDVASAVAPFARWGGSKSDPYANSTLPDDPGTRQAFFQFQERNVGIMILRTKKPVVKQLIRDWLDIYVKDVGDLFNCKKYFHEQPAFREALFKLKGQISERLLPLDKVCREGDAIIGCQLKKGCITDGCDMVHCHVNAMNRHKSRKEIMAR